MRELSQEGSFGDQSYGLMLVGFVVFVVQVLPSLKDFPVSTTPAELASGGACAYELIEDGRCTGTLFLEGPETIQGIARRLGRADHVKWAGLDDLVPCGSVVRVHSDTSAIRLGTMAGSRLVAAGRRIDVNRCQDKDLSAVPGIGPVLAERIAKERARRGGFSSPQDLRQIKGIGDKKLAMMSRWIVVGPRNPVPIAGPNH